MDNDTTESNYLDKLVSFEEYDYGGAYDYFTKICELFPDHKDELARLLRFKLLEEDSFVFIKEHDACGASFPLGVLYVDRYVLLALAAVYGFRLEHVRFLTSKIDKELREYALTLILREIKEAKNDPSVQWVSDGTYVVPEDDIEVGKEVTKTFRKISDSLSLLQTMIREYLEYKVLGLSNDEILEKFRINYFKLHINRAYFESFIEAVGADENIGEIVEELSTL